MGTAKTRSFVIASGITLVLVIGSLLFAHKGQDGITQPETVFGAQAATPTPDPFFTILDVAWSPNGDYVAFRTFGGGGRSGDIYLIQPDGQAPTNITNSPDDREIGVKWSPDGKKLAYLCFDEERTDICATSIEDFTTTNLTENVANSSDLYFAWSPDSVFIAFTTYGRDEETLLRIDSTLWQVSLESGEVTQLFSRDGFLGPLPSWSPDGQFIAFSLVDENIQQIGESDPEYASILENSGLGILRLEDGSVNKVADGLAILPQWSPDGTKIAYLDFCPTPTGSTTIKILDMDGEIVNSTLNTEQCIFTVPSAIYTWSPDSNYLAYVASEESLGETDIYVLEIETLHAENMTGEFRETHDVSFMLGSFSWSPNGSQIAFSDSHNIWIMNADGTNPVKIFPPDSE